MDGASEHHEAEEVEGGAVQGERRQEAGKEPAARARNIVIRSYPKTVFLYPSGLGALVAAVVTALDVVPAEPLGLAFCTLLFLNLLVVSFEFRRHTPLVIALVALVLVLAGVLLDERFGIVHFLRSLVRHVHMAANAEFYAGIAAGFLVLLAAILAAARFDYWEVRGNEVLHHHGFLGDCERFPAPSLTLTKEITDVFEFLLLGSGRLVLHPSGRTRAIVLDNVPRINKVERQLSELLDSVQVTVERPT